MKEEEVPHPFVMIANQTTAEVIGKQLDMLMAVARSRNQDAYMATRECTFDGKPGIQSGIFTKSEISLIECVIYAKAKPDGEVEIYEPPFMVQIGKLKRRAPVE